MKRNEFIKITGLSTGTILTGSAFTGLLSGLSSCKKGHGMNTKPVIVNEGSFTKLLSFPTQAGANHTLTAQVTSTTVSGFTIPVLGYQQNNLLGPTFRINKGDAVNILLQNNLSEHTNVHWHGLKVPALMDGHPDQIANAGGTFRYQFTINQRAGLSWYHPHPHEHTGKQVFQGLAGMFLINDAEEAALNLPSGAYELPLVLQDKRITSGGIPYNPGEEEVMAGFMGETMLVNGVDSPYTEVATRYYRLRILNASNARVYNLALSNNADMTIIGNDGGLLKNAVAVKDILIAPGERLDVLVNFAGLSIGTDVYLNSKEFSNGGDAQGKQGFKIMKFKVAVSATDTFTIPATLSVIPTLTAASAVKTRTFDISNEMEHRGLRMEMTHRINGKQYDSNRIDEFISANTNEIWVFDNSKGDEPHPMHLHGVFFQVLQRSGGRNQLTAAENGWKDTVLVLAGETIRVLVPFENNKGKFVFHCHNLEHGDDGMMLQYQVS